MEQSCSVHTKLLFYITLLLKQRLRTLELSTCCTVNKSLMSGRDLTNQIIGVLVKFREKLVAVMADIEAML